MANKLDFLETLQSDNERHRPCQLSIALRHMDQKMAVQVREAMASEVPGAAIARTLQRFNYPVSEGAIRRCRRICDCWKVTDGNA